MVLRALDLFCCAGGATRGLIQAGFEVTGIDINPQPHYPSTFLQGDALSQPLEFYQQFDFIWASPPCQLFCAYRRREGYVRERPNLIPATRELLQTVGKLYVIENVVGAPLFGYNTERPVTLCGSHFGLDVRRHRLFESNFPIQQPRCRHVINRRFPAPTNNGHLRSTVEIGVWRIPLPTQLAAMGYDSSCNMTREELSQSIPPAYARYIGEAAKTFIPTGTSQQDL